MCLRLRQVAGLLQQVERAGRQRADRQWRQLAMGSPSPVPRTRTSNGDAGHGGLLCSDREVGRWFCLAGTLTQPCTDLPDPTGSTASARNERRILLSRPDPRREHQAADLGETIEGQLGLVSGHLDPDGLLGLALGVDRVQPHGPDRPPVPVVPARSCPCSPAAAWPRRPPGTACRSCRSEVA